MRRVRTWIRLAIVVLVWAATPAAARAQAAAKPALPTSMADLKPVKQDDRMLKAPPVIEIAADGTATVSFETAVPAPAGRLYLGTLNAYTTLDTPFFPVTIRESFKEPATAHRISADLRRLDGWLPKAAEGAAREAEAYIRLELYDSRTGGARYFESTVHYAVTGSRYEQRVTVEFGPVIDQVTTSSALISWNTDSPAPGTVELWSGDGAKKLAEFKTPEPASSHPVVRIDGLKPRGAYAYRVLITSPADGRVVNTGRTFTFHAAPSATEPFKFAFLSDGRPSSGGGFINFNSVNVATTPRLIADGYRRGADFAIYAGDLTSGYTSSVENFRMILDTFRHVNDPVAHQMPIYEGFGNHESLHNFYVDAAGNRYSTDRLGDTSSEAEFAAKFVNPEAAPAPEVRDGITGPPYKGTVYSFDYGNSHFVMINSDYWFTVGGPSRDTSLAWKLLGGNREGYLMPNQLAWLDQDLAAARKRGVTHIFLSGHEPVLPVSGHISDAMWWRGMDDKALASGDVLTMRNKFLSMVVRYHVTALLCGHEHAYARVVIDQSIDRMVTHPIVQFVSGGAGAPFYTQDESAPWAKNVLKFAATNHYVLFSVAGPVVKFEAIDLDGRVIDSGVIK